MASERTTRHAGLACTAMLCALLAGCQTANVKQTVVSQFGGIDADAQLDFWHTLAEQPVTSNDDAFHGLLLFLDGQDLSGTYEQRVSELKRRKMLPSGFDAPADAAVTRGNLAVALSRALGIKGGLTMRLFGPVPRYATRELYFEGVYPWSGPYQTFSGAEYLGIIGKAEDYQRGNKTAIPAAVMPGETEG
jgi:hypothetical protein